MVYIHTKKKSWHGGQLFLRSIVCVGITNSQRDLVWKVHPETPFLIYYV